MKNFLKILFLIFLFLASIFGQCTYTGENSSNKINIYYSTNNVYLENKENTSASVVSNNNNFEITSLFQKKDSNLGFNPINVIKNSTNRGLFTKFQNQNCVNNSNKISLYLQNEIYTRAP